MDSCLNTVFSTFVNMTMYIVLFKKFVNFDIVYYHYSDNLKMIS